MPKPTQLQTVQLLTILGRFCEDQKLEPAEMIYALNTALNALAEKATPKSPVGYLRSPAFRDGKGLNKDDNGPGIGRVEKRADGIIYFVLGQMAVNWIAFTPELAKHLANQLVKVADGPADPNLRAGEPPEC